MKRWALIGVGVAALLAAGAYIEHSLYLARALDTAIVVEPQKAALRPAPIRKDWITSGDPITEAALIAKSDDGSTKVFVWETSKGEFDWGYDFDEVFKSSVARCS